MIKEAKMEKIGGYEVKFDGVNVTIDCTTKTVWEWLDLEILQDDRPGLLVSLDISYQRVLVKDITALHRALVTHAQTLCQPQEFWIHLNHHLAGNVFEKAVLENAKSFVKVGPDGCYYGADKQNGWSRVDAPWWEYTCPVCGKKHKAFIDKDIAGRIYFPDGSCGADIADNLDSHLKVKAYGKFYSCDLKPGKWNPELKEEVKRAIRVKREFCSQCNGLVFQEDKKCRQCGAELEIEAMEEK